MNQANLPGDAIGYINFPSFLIGTSVIDTNQFKPAVPGVHYPDDGPKREVRVGRRQGLEVKLLAVRRDFAVEVRSIPACVPDPWRDGFDWLAEVGNEGGFHHRSNQEHQRYPAKGSPSHEQWTFHSVLFL